MRVTDMETCYKLMRTEVVRSLPLREERFGFEPEVTALLASNPFPNAPPRYIRSVAYDYHFTDFTLRRATGNWWQREQKGLYFPEVSLQRRQ